jgi:hypothetical protein
MRTASHPEAVRVLVGRGDGQLTTLGRPTDLLGDCFPAPLPDRDAEVSSACDAPFYPRRRSCRQLSAMTGTASQANDRAAREHDWRLALHRRNLGRQRAAVYGTAAEQAGPAGRERHRWRQHRRSTRATPLFDPATTTDPPDRVPRTPNPLRELRLRESASSARLTTALESRLRSGYAVPSAPRSLQRLVVKARLSSSCR